MISTFLVVALLVPGAIFYVLGNVFRGPLAHTFTALMAVFVVGFCSTVVLGPDLNDAGKAVALTCIAFMASFTIVQVIALYLEGWKEKIAMLIWFATVILAGFSIPTLIYR